MYIYAYFFFFKKKKKNYFLNIKNLKIIKIIIII